jgi:hypothetical protein
VVQNGTTAIDDPLGADASSVPVRCSSHLARRLFKRLDNSCAEPSLLRLQIAVAGGV